MKSCQRCGNVFNKTGAIFCGQCGHNNSWAESEVDLPENIGKYAIALHHLFFDPGNTQEALGKYAVDLRERLKISFGQHEIIMVKFTERRSAIAQMLSLRIEFDENISDAYAGHDTHMRFRITNPSNNAEMFKAILEWDDPETPNPVDFRAMTDSFVKPGQAQEIAGTHVFMRAGPKQISQMYLAVENQFFDQCKFVVSPFSFRVGSFQQQVVNNITTHNQISIEGRGVVDASNMGGASAGVSPDDQPRWKVLNFTLALDASLMEELTRRAATVSMLPADGHAVDPSMAASAVGQRTDPKDVSTSTAANELGEAVDRLFHDLEGLIVQHSPSEKARLIASAKLDLNSLEEVGAYIGEEGPHLVYGFVVADASQVAVDGSGSVTGFGDAVVVSENGLSVIMNSAERQGESRFFEWNQLDTHGMGFYGQKFGPKGFLLFFGNSSSRSFLPGCRFDLRRYQGAETMDAVVARFQAQLDEIKLFAPLSESTQPRPLGASCSETNSESITDDGNSDNSSEADEVDSEEFSGEEVWLQNGDHWVGGVVNGNVIQGEGVYTWSAAGPFPGMRYEGDAYGGCLHGTGTLHYPDGKSEFVVYRLGKYLGEAEDWVFPDGSDYSGIVDEEGPHGFGIQSFADGSMYRGDFANGVRHGLGQHIDPLGNVSDCVYFEMDSYPSLGSSFKGNAEVFIYPDGVSYFGTLVDGKPNGFGEVRFADGSYVFGKVSTNGSIHGIADYYNSDGAGWDAVYNNGQFLGTAETLYFEGGDRFTGIVENGIAEKFGVYVFSDSGPYAGHWYEGEFKGGQFNGFGVYTFPDGSTQVGNFVNGKRNDGQQSSGASSDSQKKGFWKSFKDGFKDGYKSTGG